MRITIFTLTILTAMALAIYCGAPFDRNASALFPCKATTTLMIDIGSVRLDFPAALLGTVDGKSWSYPSRDLRECSEFAELVPVVRAMRATIRFGREQKLDATLERYERDLRNRNIQIQQSTSDVTCRVGIAGVVPEDLRWNKPLPSGTQIFPGVIEHNPMWFSIITTGSEGPIVRAVGSCLNPGLEGGRRVMATCAIVWHTRNGLCINMHYSLSTNNSDGSEASQMQRSMIAMVGLVRKELRCADC